MPCMFPFQYHDQWYSDCTTVDSSQKNPWCAVETKFQSERWGYCPLTSEYCLCKLFLILQCENAIFPMLAKHKSFQECVAEDWNISHLNLHICDITFFFFFNSSEKKLNQAKLNWLQLALSLAIVKLRSPHEYACKSISNLKNLLWRLLYRQDLKCHG